MKPTARCPGADLSQFISSSLMCDKSCWTKQHKARADDPNTTSLVNELSQSVVGLITNSRYKRSSNDLLLKETANVLTVMALKIKFLANVEKIFKCLIPDCE